MDFLSFGFCKRRINREWQHCSRSNMQRMKGSKWLFSIIIVNEFKLAVVHFARPNPLQTCALTVGQKTVENLDRAAGPSWAAGRRAAGPSRAVVLGPLGRGPGFSKTRGILPSFRPIMLHKPCFLKVLHQAELYNEHEDNVISEIMPNETVCFPSLKSHYLPPLIGVPFWKQDFPVVFSISPFPSSSALPRRALPCVTLKTTGDDRQI